MNLKNIPNPYQEALGDLFGDAQKAVIAAVAVSALTCGGDNLADAMKLFAAEWVILHQNGIVKQAPTACARNLAAQVQS